MCARVIEMAVIHLLTLMICWSVVEVNSQQTFPYVSFMGQTLANHSYVNLSLVGTSGSDSVQCHTDLDTCCSGAQGSHRGDWYFPNETRLPFSGIFHQSRRGRKVDLHHYRSSTSQSGIFCCTIATIAVHYEYGSEGERVYVGMYTTGGMSYD